MDPMRVLFRLVLGRRLPTTEGAIAVQGLEREVRIRRDRWGVPHIDAETDTDAWYALGFCQGQDRAFQLEVLLRVVRGTLAEVLGPEALPVDRLSRHIGFHRSAQRQLPVLDPDIRAAGDAYARGVTAGATCGLRHRPHEFVLLRAAPTPWTAADSLGVLKLQSFALAANWDVELARLAVLREDGAEALAALDPAYPEWLPVTAPPAASAGRALDALAADLDVLAGVVSGGGSPLPMSGGGGSNNWALTASRTATGRPLLANDPHLAPTLPPHWYLAHLRTPRWSVAGAAFVGGPVFPVAHNGFAAWGVTAGLLDNTDLFLEEVGPDGRSIREGDAFVPCAVRVERIRVKGAQPVTETVLVTPRGPIIGPALDGAPAAVSLRAVWLDPHPAVGLYRVHEARSFEELRRTFADWPFVSLNVVYADGSGRIGWQLVGQAPRRRAGRGTVPLPGWLAGSGWEEAGVPFEEMPHCVDPPAGFIATANGRPTADGETPFLGVDWIDGYRLARIVEVLAERSDHDVGAAMSLQSDVLSIPWRELRDAVLSSTGDEATARGLGLLRAWDGRVSADSPAAAVFELFLAEMSVRVAAAKAPRSFRWAVGRGFSPVVPASLFAVRRVGHLVRLLRERPTGWFARSWQDEIADALGAAVRWLEERHGSDMAEWAWGRVRPLTLRHPFGTKRPLDRVFNLGPFPHGGDANTPAQAAVAPLQPCGDPVAIASLRATFDVGSWEDCRFVLPGGQSGNPLSPHYADQLPLWRRGEGIPIAWSEATVAAATVDTLHLRPA